jgi:hypothetical protein
VPIQVPAVVEARLRKRWSRRAKLIGIGLFAGYAILLVLLFRFNVGPWIYFVTTSGVAVAVRYLRAGRHLAEQGELIADQQTQELIGSYEEKIRIEGEREVAHGSLSMPSGLEDGKLSLPREASALSSSEE